MVPVWPSSRERVLFRRLVYPLAASVGVGFGAILYGTSVLITSQAAGAEFSIGLLSTGFSGSVLTGAAVAVPIGRRADRHGIRGIVGLGGLLVALGFLGFAVTTASWQVIAVWWLLIGPGSAMVLFDPAFVAIQQWFEPRDRNRAAGTLTVVTGFAGPVFVPATTAAVQAMGWRPTAAVLGGVVLVIAWMTAGLALRAAPRPRPGPERHPKLVGRLPAGFIPLTGAIVTGLAAVEAIQLHRIARFEITGFDPGTLAFWAATASLLSLPGRFLLPRLANRFSSPWLLLIVTALLAPALALAIRGTTSVEMIGHFVIFGLLFGAVIPLRAVVMSDWFSGARFGALMGVQAVAIAVGRSGGPALVGWVADGPGGYPLAMALLTGLLVVSGGLLVIAVHLHKIGGTDDTRRR